MTPRSRISVSAISTYQLSLEDDIEFWRRHEIHRVGPSVTKMEAAGWDAAVSALAATEIEIANLIGIGKIELQAAIEWPEQRSRLQRAIDAAAQLGAPTLVCTTGPARDLEWSEAADRLEDALAPVIAHAHSANVALALEHTHSLRVDVGFVHTLRDAVDLAQRLGIGVCMEVNACWAERDLAATIRKGIGTIGVVQVSDYAIGTRSTPDRLVPGDGDIPLARILGAVHGAGYTGDFDLELVGPQIEAEGYDSAVPRAITALTALLDDVARDVTPT